MDTFSSSLGVEDIHVRTAYTWSVEYPLPMLMYIKYYILLNYYWKSHNKAAV